MINTRQLSPEITVIVAPTYRADIHIGGDIADVRRACSEFCLTGLCVSITEETFVYTGGVEVGARVGLINYPRFPETNEYIFGTAQALASFLMDKLFQSSCTIVATDESLFMTRRAS